MPHPLRIKVDGAGGASYTLGVTASGTEGTANATVTFVVPECSRCLEILLHRAWRCYGQRFDYTGGASLRQVSTE